MGEFQTDLKLGIRAQDFIIKQLSKEFPGIKSIQGNFSNYDLESDSGYTIEVKFDIKSKLTDNVGFEYEYKKQPSGLAKTKAMEWVHLFYLNGDCVYSRIKVPDLKAYLRNNWKYLVKLNGGDRNAAKMVLVKTEDFIKTFNYIPVK